MSTCAVADGPADKPLPVERGVCVSGEDDSTPSALAAEALVREFWRLMASNDFESVKAVLSEQFVLEWPQSKERIRGAHNFARMNAEYPTAGRWQFRINRFVATETSVVTQVSVSDGTLFAEPISFFTVADGKIVQLTEYWPEPFAAPDNRRHLTEPVAGRQP